MTPPALIAAKMYAYPLDHPQVSRVILNEINERNFYYLIERNIIFRIGEKAYEKTHR